MKKRNQALNIKKGKPNLSSIEDNKEEEDQAKKDEVTYLSNQYWKIPESFDIEDLLQDFD